ncbi:MAG: hypothetical protein H6621_05935 [Halobacteriovoraceae bacterium]|nr:hypothetical protein [Halobacteriovoraceae bacterium]
MDIKTDWESQLREQNENFLVSEFLKTFENYLEFSRKVKKYKLIPEETFSNVQSPKINFLHEIYQLEKCSSEFDSKNFIKNYEKFYQNYFRDYYRFDSGEIWRELKKSMEINFSNEDFVFGIVEKECDLLVKIFTAKKLKVIPPFQHDLELIIELFIFKDELRTGPSTILKYLTLLNDEDLLKKFKNTLYRKQNQKTIDNFTMSLKERRIKDRVVHYKDIVIHKDQFENKSKAEAVKPPEVQREEITIERTHDFLHFLNLNDDISFSFLFQTPARILDKISLLEKREKLKNSEAHYYRGLAYYKMGDCLNAWRELNQIEDNVSILKNVLELKNKCRERINQKSER